ncbi:UDP-glucoronosyl and UDP-glucosyl transferase [Oesophagostomum dentatum]|uniref:glucuronosyltransferase n=1 Tax=Oesophagostomum dentatum TaxID=61180 RepID=A0A0B1SSX8_OESDE|nr:UDP-glucoronosyl and UDP-glucosyl transferase [Oesophagostomum dentatum]
MKFMGSIADTLVEAGHEVVTLQPLIIPHANCTSRSRLIQVETDKKMVAEMMAAREKKESPAWTVGSENPLSVVGFLPHLKRIVYTSVSDIKIFIVVLKDRKLLKELRAEKFDLGIGELFDFIGITVFEAIGLKNIVGAHSGCLMEGTAYAIGAPVIPSFMPASQGVTDDSTSLSTRAKNMLFTFVSWYFQAGLASSAEKAMMEKLGTSAPPIWVADVVSNITWILTNTEPFMEFAKPTLHTVVDIGGIAVRKPKPLDEKWNKVLSLRPRTVLISFGSVLLSYLMPNSMKMAIVEVVKSYPDITFIWKYERPENATFADGVENLVLSKWTPQTDLLGKQFICTLKLLIEFAISWRNDHSTPEQKLVKTVELAAEFGQIPELRVAGRDMNFIVCHNLDLLALFFIVCSLFTFAILYCLKKLFGIAIRRPKAKED